MMILCDEKGSTSHKNLEIVSTNPDVSWKLIKSIRVTDTTDVPTLIGEQKKTELLLGKGESKYT